MFECVNYKSSLKELKSLLARAKSGKCEFMDLGICHNTHYYTRRLFNEIIRTWPKYSGHNVYPIPGYRTTSCPKRAYHRGNLWTGYKLKLRIEALEFAISELEYRSSYE